MLCEAGDREILDFQDGLPAALRVAVRIELGHVATNHQARHLYRLQFVRRMASDNAAVAQHGHLVGDLLNFRQPMRNIEDADALGADIGDDLEQCPRLDRRERSGRFVEYYDAVRNQKYPRYLDELTLRDGKTSYHYVRIDVGTEIAYCLTRAFVHCTIVDHHALGQLAAEIHILCDREIGREKDFLVNQDGAAPLRVDRSRQRHGFAVDPQFAARRLQMAGEQLHESGLAGSVLADDSVNLPGIDRQADILQHLDRTEGLRQPDRLAPDLWQ